jgi:RNase_H superfamily
MGAVGRPVLFSFLVRQRQMKRVCFDIATNLYRDPTRNAWLNSPEDARECFQEQTCKFHAATMFDSDKKYNSFSHHEELFAYLVNADEIITFNGRIYDLIALEHLIGESSVRALWEKPHHDLHDWRGQQSLRGAVERFLPELAPSFETTRKDRLDEISKSYDNGFIASHLADTYRDVKFTYALFEKYRDSGGTDRTFYDGNNL